MGSGSRPIPNVDGTGAVTAAGEDKRRNREVACLISRGAVHFDGGAAM
jgi:hypothetical protein